MFVTDKIYGKCWYKHVNMRFENPSQGKYKSRIFNEIIVYLASYMFLKIHFFNHNIFFFRLERR